jgi:hypothetical protein
LGALLLSSLVLADYLDDENDAIVIEGKHIFIFKYRNQFNCGHGLSSSLEI